MSTTWLHPYVANKYTAHFYDHKHWGSSEGKPISDPNPRLEMLIDAARRGATVHILLDSFFDEPEERRSNRARVDYLNLIAANEGLDRIAAAGGVAGGDVSQKLNLAVVLLVNVHAVYDGLEGVFLHDWALRTR